MAELENVAIDDVKIKPLVRHCDERGYFMEVLRDEDNLLERFGQSSYTISYPA